MYIVFYVLVAMALAAAWFLLSFLFPVIGKFLISIFTEAKANIKGGKDER